MFGWAWCSELAGNVIVVIRGHCGGTCLLLLLSTLLGVTGNWGSVCLELMCRGQAR